MQACLFAGGSLFAADTDTQKIRAPLLYKEHCAACHGTKGKGDGPVGYEFKVRPTDLTDAQMWLLDDDDMMIVLTNGKKEMPRYRKLLGEDDRRALVAYMRTLAPKPAATKEQP